MKLEYLQHFTTLEQESFATLMRHLGFGHAACYRITGEQAALIVGFDDPNKSWPVALSDTHHYTRKNLPGLVIGWRHIGVGKSPRSHWPKGTILYFPEQEQQTSKIFFAVQPAGTKRQKDGDLDGALQVVAARIGRWIDHNESRVFFNEASFDEHIRALNINVVAMIDHLLRTPAASIAGYASLLSMISHEDVSQIKDFVHVIEKQTSELMSGLEKLQVTLKSHVDGAKVQPATEVIDLGHVLSEMVTVAKLEAIQIVGVDAARELDLKFHYQSDFSCRVRGVPALIRWALWEVVKNAMVHARRGIVSIKLYQSDAMVVVDIEDDGQGVAAGSEELIFLKFYQDPSSQRGRRQSKGLGLGLYFARHLAEQHMGKLLLINRKGHGAMFRFIFPVAPAQESSLSEKKGA